MSGLVVDLFAGGGGASAGIRAALGREVDVAINHDPVALAVHCTNHPRTRHLSSDIWEVRPRDATGGRPVSLLWASPDCTHFSAAKGGKPRKQGIRSLAWVVVRWAKEVRPSVICLENVQEFRTWGPLVDGRPDRSRLGETFRRWVRALERLGYAVDHRVLDASLYGAPTRRRRLFVIARCDGRPIRWPEPSHGLGKQKRGKRATSRAQRPGDHSPVNDCGAASTVAIQSAPNAGGDARPETTFDGGSTDQGVTGGESAAFPSPDHVRAAMRTSAHVKRNGHKHPKAERGGR